MSTLVFYSICIIVAVALLIVGVVKVINSVKARNKMKYGFAEWKEEKGKEEQRYKQVIEKVLNTYYECSVCGKIITYHDVKDSILPSDLSLRVPEPTKIITRLCDSASHSHLEGAQLYEQEPCEGSTHYHVRPSKVQLTELHGHKHITYEQALQYAQGLAMCREYKETKRATQKAQEYINARLDSKK